VIEGTDAFNIAYGRWHVTLATLMRLVTRATCATHVPLVTLVTLATLTTLATLATLATTEIRLTIINFRKEMALLYSKHGPRGAREIWRRTYGVRKLPAASTFKYHFDNLNKNQSLENQVSLWNIFHENRNYKYCFQYHRTSMRHVQGQSSPRTSCSTSIVRWLQKNSGQQQNKEVLVAGMMLVC
jgi:hypothetical protein